MKATLLTPIIGVGIALAQNAHGSDELIGKTQGYEIILRTETDGQSAVALLKNDGKILQASESVLELVSFAPSSVKKELLEQVIKNEIQKEGGAAKYQQKINRNLREYGKNFFNYMGQDVRDVYAKNGVRFDLVDNTQSQKQSGAKTSEDRERTSVNTEGSQQTQETQETQKSQSSIEWD